MNFLKEIGGFTSSIFKTSARLGGSVTEETSAGLGNTVKDAQNSVHNKINTSTMSPAAKVASHIGVGAVGYTARGLLGFTKIVGKAVKNEVGKK